MLSEEYNLDLNINTLDSKNSFNLLSEYVEIYSNYFYACILDLTKKYDIFFLFIEGRLWE